MKEKFIEYEIIGDNEWCAASPERHAAFDYAGQYLDEYTVVQVYKVTRELVMELRANK